MEQETERRVPRIRTGLIPMTGGLEENKQYVRMGVLPPQIWKGKQQGAKIFISSVIQDRMEEGRPKIKHINCPHCNGDIDIEEEFLSLRSGDWTEIKSFFVAHVLQMREFSRFKPMEKGELNLKQQLIGRIERAWEGHFDKQIQNFSIYKRE